MIWLNLYTVVLLSVSSQCYMLSANFLMWTWWRCVYVCVRVCAFYWWAQWMYCNYATFILSISLTLSLSPSFFHLSLPLLPPPPWFSPPLLAAARLSLQALTQSYWKGIIKALWESTSVPLQSYDFITVYPHTDTYTQTHTATVNTRFSRARV